MRSFLLLFMLLPTWVLAQQSPVAGGGDAVGPGGSVSFSVGQVAYKHYQGTASVNEGVQQVYEISPVTSLQEDENLFQLVAYPNPTADVLWLEVLGDAELGETHYQMVSVSGQHLGSGMITSNRTEISMAHVAPGSYVLRISGANNQSFRIIKNR